MSYWETFGKKNDDGKDAAVEQSQADLVPRLPVAPTQCVEIPGTPNVDDLVTDFDYEADGAQGDKENSMNSVNVPTDALDKTEMEPVDNDKMDAPLVTKAPTTPKPVDKEAQKLQLQKFEAKVQGVLRLRHRLVECFRLNREDKYQPLLRQLQDLTMSRYILQKTGVGYLVSKPKDWPQRLQPVVRALKDKWFQMAKPDDALHGSSVVRMLPLDKIPFRGMSAKKFMHAVEYLAAWMKSVDKDFVSGEIYKEGAMALCITGIDTPEAMDGLSAEDAADFHQSPTVRSMLSRSFDVCGPECAGNGKEHGGVRKGSCK